MASVTRKIKKLLPGLQAHIDFVSNGGTYQNVDLSGDYLRGYQTALKDVLAAIKGFDPLQWARWEGYEDDE